MTTIHLLSFLKLLQSYLPAPVYAVGGAVRNNILGKYSQELDCAISMRVEDVVSILETKVGFQIKQIIPEFGVVKFNVATEQGDTPLELTTFRSEVYSRHTRFPKVTFIDYIEVDAGRRDFTINALYMDSEGTIYDFLGGAEDLDKGILKTTYDPAQSFQDDPLRILRAGRLIAEYGFDYDNSWKEIVPNVKVELFKANKALWVSELDRILVGDYVRKGLDFLQYNQLFDILIPELSRQLYLDQKTPYHNFDLWEHTLNVIEDTPQTDLNLRWSALLHDIAKPFTQTYDLERGVSHFYRHEVMGEELVRGVGLRLKFDQERTDYIAQAVRNHLKSGTRLKVYDDKRKRLPADYAKPMIVMIGGGKAFETYDEYLDDLRIQELRLGGDLLWTSWLEKEVRPWYDFFKFPRPNCDNAQYAEWKIRFERCQEYFGSDLILIGWSLGGIFLLKYLSEESHGLNIVGVHFIASPYPDCASFSLKGPARLSGVSTDKVFVYHSSDDLIVPLIEGQRLVKDLDLPQSNVMYFEDRNHFLQKELPELLKHLFNRINL